MTEQDHRDIIGFIKAYKEVYKWHSTLTINAVVVIYHNDLGNVFRTPEEVREDILFHKWGVPKGML